MQVFLIDMKDCNLIKPDDWHCHLRDNEFLARTVIDTAAQFARAIVMPNLNPPITSVAQARAYAERIANFIPKNIKFTPLMTLYLTEGMTPQSIYEAKNSGLIIAYKLYPQGATTHSATGVANLQRIYPLLNIMQECDIPLLIHGESINPEIDIFDREKAFIDSEMHTLLKQFPALRMVLEHISTNEAVQFIQEAPPQLAATITAHHLWLNRNDLLIGGLKPHHYCLPILKSSTDQMALIKAVTSGHPKFFLGTDSAPHERMAKESSCCPAGIYTAHTAIALYAQVFEKYNALNQLEAFASLNGPRFYKLPINSEKIILQKKTYAVPEHLSFGHGIVIPLLAGKTVDWQIGT